MCEINPKHTKFYRVELFTSQPLSEAEWQGVALEVDIELVKFEQACNESGRVRVHVHETDEWTPTPPTEPGWYWFYGCKSGASRTALATVEVVIANTAHPSRPRVPMLLCDGDLWLSPEDHTGVYQPMAVPVLPAGVVASR